MSEAANTSSIGRRLLLLSLLPIAVVTLFFVPYTLNERFTDLERALDQSGLATSSYLASRSEIALFAKDKNSLTSIAEEALSIPQLTSIVFTTPEGEILVNGGKALATDQLRNCFNQGSAKLEHQRIFCQPIGSYQFSVSDFDEGSEGQMQQHGWVIIGLSTDYLNQQRSRILSASLAVAFLGVVVGTLLALRIGRSIANPVRTLTERVALLTRGQLDTPLEVKGPSEIASLSKGVKQLAISIRDAQDTLEGRVQSATAALTETMDELSERNQQLERARDEIEQALKAKDQFLARMSHELRTPLTSVIGYADLATGTDIKGDTKEYIHNIGQASSLLLATIDDILDFSKLQSQALHIESIDFDLRECMEGLISMYAHQAYQKALELVLIVDADVPSTLRGDPMRLRQVISNLLANAIKFTQQGEIIVRVYLHESDDKENTIHFQVKDSGIGIAKEQINKLFEPFSQADDSITRLYGGSGLGLNICQQLCQLMGGDIHLHSLEGEGTEVTVELVYPILKQFKKNSLRFDELNILVFDENPWARRALRAQLLHYTENLYIARSETHLKHLLSDAHYQFDLVIIGLRADESEEAYLSERLADLRISYQGPLLMLACINHFQSAVSSNIISDYAPLHCLSKPLKGLSLSNLLTIISGQGEVDHGAPAKQREQLLSGREILIAEDNQYNRRLIKTLLELYGAAVCEASTGIEAVAAQTQLACDLVLMDIHMPDMDGIAASAEIHRHAPQTPIIGLTANTVESEHSAMLEAGAVDMLFKPLDEEKMIRSICQHLDIDELSSLDNGNSILSSLPRDNTAIDKEVLRLLGTTRSHLQVNEINDARERVHELLGLAGLYGRLTLHDQVSKLQRLLIEKQEKAALDQLRRIESTQLAAANRTEN